MTLVQNCWLSWLCGAVKLVLWAHTSPLFFPQIPYSPVKYTPTSSNPFRLIYSSNADFLPYWTSGVSEKVEFSLNSSSRYCQRRALIKLYSNIPQCCPTRRFHNHRKRIFSSFGHDVLHSTFFFRVTAYFLMFQNLAMVDLHICYFCATWFARFSPSISFIRAFLVSTEIPSRAMPSTVSNVIDFDIKVVKQYLTHHQMEWTETFHKIKQKFQSTKWPKTLCDLQCLGRCISFVYEWKRNTNNQNILY